MNLTPIKVKGRGRKQAWQPPDPSRIKSSRRGRDDENGHDNARSDSSRSSKRFKKSAPEIPGPTLETLPAEILWPIVVMSQNPNLMRTNRNLRNTLSAKSFLLELAVAAFRPTWDIYFGQPTRSIDSGEYKTDRFPGDPQFQGKVLAARWMNIDFILQAQQVWYRQESTKRRWEKAPCIWWTPPTQAQKNQEGQQAEGRQQTKEGQEAKDKHQEVPLIKEWFDQDWQEFCEACSYVEHKGKYRSIAMNVGKESKEGYLDLHPLTAIPDRLLKGPFDLEKTRLLFWLVRGGARILPQHNWEVTKLGFEQIMALEDNITLAPYLIYFYHALGVFDQGHWPDFLLEEKLQWLQEMKQELSVDARDLKYRLCCFALAFEREEREARAVTAEFRAYQ